MTKLLTHVAIHLKATTTDIAVLKGYDALLEPFMRPPRDSMFSNTEKSVRGDAVSCKVHIYGQCELDDELRDALFALVSGVPEVRVELSRGQRSLDTALMVNRNGEAEAYRPRIEGWLTGGNFRIVLEGACCDDGRQDDGQTHLKLVV